MAGCLGATKGALIIADKVGSRSDQMNWSWDKGADTSLADFGDPVNGGTSYQVCVYDEVGGVPHLVMQSHAPAGGTCLGGFPCWALTPRGYVYNNKGFVPEGLVRLMLRPTNGSKLPKILVRGAGQYLSLPAPASVDHLFSQDAAVTIQLLREDSSNCWESVFAAPASRNKMTEFRDKNP